MHAYRALPLLLGTLVLVLPTASIALYIEKLLLSLALSAINGRWGEPRIKEFRCSAPGR